MGLLNANGKIVKSDEQNLDLEIDKESVSASEDSKILLETALSRTVAVNEARNLLAENVDKIASNLAGKAGAFVNLGGFDKKYYAVLKGSPAEAQGLMEDWLIRDPKRNLTEVTDSPCERAKRARAEYEIKAENQGLCLTDIRLLTGRTHQIRAQFSHRSCPVYGDSRYGGGSGELALFAHSLAFDHPATGERMIFTALPDCEKFPWNLFAQEDFSV